jgi:hypothetical protein
VSEWRGEQSFSSRKKETEFLDSLQTVIINEGYLEAFLGKSGELTPF